MVGLYRKCRPQEGVVLHCPCPLWTRWLYLWFAAGSPTTCSQRGEKAACLAKKSIHWWDNLLKAEMKCWVAKLTNGQFPKLWGLQHVRVRGISKALEDIFLSFWPSKSQPLVLSCFLKNLWVKLILMPNLEAYIFHSWRTSNIFSISCMWVLLSSLICMWFISKSDYVECKHKIV